MIYLPTYLLILFTLVFSISFTLVDYKIHYPLSIENLLPFDIKYSLQDIISKDVIDGFIEKGQKTAFSECNLNHVQKLHLEIIDTPFRKCIPAVIHHPQKRGEREIVLLDKSNNKMRLFIHEE
jgi:hypothetical protein